MMTFVPVWSYDRVVVLWNGKFYVAAYGMRLYGIGDDVRSTLVDASERWVKRNGRKRHNPFRDALRAFDQGLSPG